MLGRKNLDDGLYEFDEDEDDEDEEEDEDEDAIAYEGPPKLKTGKILANMKINRLARPARGCESACGLPSIDKRASICCCCSGCNSDFEDCVS